MFRKLPLTAAVVLAFATNAQAQSLVEMYDAARSYDAGFISAKSQFEANLAKANQTLGGILPNIAMSLSYIKTDYSYELRDPPQTAFPARDIETRTASAT